MSDALVLAVPSKGRLMEQTAAFFAKAGLELRKTGNERGYRGEIVGLDNVEVAFISSSENKTVPVGAITELVEGDVYHWGSLMAAALFGSLPVVIMYSFFVEYYVSSLTGAVKE